MKPSKLDAAGRDIKQVSKGYLAAFSGPIAKIKWKGIKMKFWRRVGAGGVGSADSITTRLPLVLGQVSHRRLLQGVPLSVSNSFHQEPANNRCGPYESVRGLCWRLQSKFRNLKKEPYDVNQ